MPGLEKLPLEEAAEDSPQSRTLLGLFHQDAMVLQDYVSSLAESARTMLHLQTELSTATQNFSKKLLNFEHQKFPLGTDDTVLASTMKQFATTIDEISSWQAVLATQLTDSMVFPLKKFLESDLAEITMMREMFNQASHEHDSAMAKYSKLSKKRENETKARIEANEELYISRKKYHQIALNYYTALNNIQYKRKTAILEPLLGFLHSQLASYKMGHEGLSQNLEDFLTNISVSVQSVHSELAMEQQKAAQVIEQIIANGTYYYTPDPTPDMQLRPRPVDTSVKQKAGYLFVRCKQGFTHRWDRRYFFTQGGNLMSQPREQFAGTLVMDLDKCNVQRMDIDDRRYTFQVVSADRKVSVILQAESGSDREEWLAAIQNISREMYRNDLPVDSSTESSESSPSPTSSASSTGIQPSPAQRQADPALLASTRQEMLSTREKGKSRLRSRSRSDSSDSNTSPGPPPPTPLDTVLPPIPIQFDLLSPGDDQPSFRLQPKEGPPKLSTPSTFSQMYLVRFLGCMEVSSDKGTNMISETIRQIMAARAIHNVFKMTEVHLLVTTDSLLLLEPSNQTVRSKIELKDLSFFAAHHENNRLFAFIVRSRGYTTAMTTFACHVFESDASGEEICRAISTATQIAFQTMLNMKTSDRPALSASSSEEGGLSQDSYQLGSSTAGAASSLETDDMEGGIPALPMDPNTLSIGAISLDPAVKPKVSSSQMDRAETCSQSSSTSC
ncbi:DCC-interacting protein 13-alpha-like isoform X2 [Ptychodera flava]|uniref:DCC-interacting protein 13-alpha-like isoform X2 n=1 Tax=Ptychodera flava TaxID=63121 RepID=UPI003969EF43